MNAQAVMRQVRKQWVNCPVWLQQLLFIGWYTAVLLYSWHISFNHWFLPAGIKVLTLIVLPYRYWIAMALCDSLAAIPAIIDCGSKFSLLWKVLMLVPQNLFIMPLVALGRTTNWLPKPPHWEQSIAIIPLMALMFISAVLTPAWDILISLTRPVQADDANHILQFSRYVLGDYLGIITLVPTGLFVAKIVKGQPPSRLKVWLQCHKQIIAKEVIFNLAIVVILDVVIYHTHKAGLALLLRAGLVMPIVYSTERYGWGGAALASTLSSIALAVLAPADYDEPTMVAEVAIGLTMTAFIALGLRISALKESGLRAQAESRRHLEIGRQLQSHAEQRFQRVGGWMSAVVDPALTPSPTLRPYLDHVLPPLESLALQNQGLQGKLRVRQLGADLSSMPLKLDEAEATPFQELQSLFEKEHIRFRGHLRGSLIDFSPLARQTICRLIVDACAYLVSRPEMHIQLDLRVRRIDRNGEPAVMISVQASSQPMIYDSIHREAQLERMLRLSSTGLELQGMAHLAGLYRGRVRHIKPNSDKRQRVQLLLINDSKQTTLDLFRTSSLV